jgi:hypothetical protein
VTTRTEWGLRRPDGLVLDYSWFEQAARRAHAGMPGSVLLKCTVTKGEWEEAQVVVPAGPDYPAHP